MLLNRNRQWRPEDWAARLGRAWRQEVRPTRRRARTRGLLRRLGDLAYLVRVEKVFLFGQLVAGYALADPDWEAADLRLLALTVLCLGPCLYGGLYALNDAADHAADRLNPVKRRRPVAAGRIRPGQARRLGRALVILGLVLAAGLDGRVFVLALAFAAINLVYTRWFKHLPGLDLVFNMATHPLRVAGGMWLGGNWSHWLLLLAWGFVGLANCAIKRLFELRTAPLASRPVLRRYTEPRLLRIIAASLGAAVGVWPFLRGLDFALAGLLLAWSFALLASHRMPIAGRVAAILSR
jgi:4-hydroxybenzoate polyprenyltransferase